MPLDALRRRVPVELIAYVDEILYRSQIHVVNRGEVDNDGLQRWSVVVYIDLLARPWARVIPWSVSRSCIAVRVRSPCLRKYHLSQVVEVVVCIRVIETFREPVNKDAWVRVLSLDCRIGAVFVAKGNEHISAHFARVTVTINARGVLVVTGIVGDLIANHVMHLDLANKTALCLEQPEDKHCGRAGYGHIDANLDGCEDCDNHTSKEDWHLHRRDSPELVDGIGRGDQVAHGVNDDSTQGRLWNVKEDRRQGVDRKQHDDRSDDACERGAHTGFRFDGCAREGPSCGVSSQEWSKEVRNTDSHQFLRWIDCVVVDTSKRLGDGDVLNQEHNHRRRKLTCKQTDNMTVHGRHGGVLEAAGNSAQEGNGRVLRVVIFEMNIHEPADESVEQNDECRAQSAEEEVQSFMIGVLPRGIVQARSDEVEHQERCETQSCVKLGGAEMLEGVDDDQVRRRAIVDNFAADAQQGRHLSHRNVDGRASHESRDGSEGDEFDEPAKTCKTEKADNRADNDSKGGCYDMAFDVRVFLGNLVYDIADDGGHDCHRLPIVSNMK